MNGAQTASINAAISSGGTATAADAKASKPANATQSERMINYEVDRNVEHVKSGLGNIQRLTTAVVVNYRTVLKDGTQRLGGAVDVDAFEAYLQANPSGVAPGAQDRITRLP